MIKHEPNAKCKDCKIGIYIAPSRKAWGQGGHCAKCSHKNFGLSFLVGKGKKL